MWFTPCNSLCNRNFADVRDEEKEFQTIQWTPLFFPGKTVKYLLYLKEKSHFGHYYHSFNLFIHCGCCFRSDFCFIISSSFSFTVINFHHLSHTDVRVRWHDEVSVVYFYLHNEKSSERSLHASQTPPPSRYWTIWLRVGGPVPYWALGQRVDEFTMIVLVT